ncbi:MAG: metallophosphoesterase [Elusimicrobiota bacterium]
MSKKSTIKALNLVYKSALKIPLNIEKGRFTVLSDQHLGDGKPGSDDFAVNRDIYLAVLNFYYENGFTIIEVGDIEELWECDFEKVNSVYSEIYALEKKFFDTGRLYRIFGNHDIFWRNRQFQRKFLPFYTIYEAIMLGDKIFITHGHQGEFVSDKFWKVSRWFVRNIWKNIQQLLHIPSNDIVQNYKIRDRKEQLFYNWAKCKKILTIFGHTHRAFFESLSKIDRLRQKLKDRTLSDNERKSIENRIKQSLRDNRKGQKELPLEDTPLPCYFNTGCCCYKNGITTIEIETGMIRLVKWERGLNAQKTVKTVFEEAELLPLLKKISTI